MTAEVLRAADRTPEKWRNGGGWTRLVAAEGNQWRVSIADVAADGPFSNFAGCDRVIMMLSGAGMALTINGRTTVVDELRRPFGFPGNADTTCRLLDGPIVDFNVIAAAGIPMTVEIVRGRTAISGETTALVMALDAPATAGGVVLGPLDAVRFDDEPEITVDGEAIALVRLGIPGASLR